MDPRHITADPGATSLRRVGRLVRRRLRIDADALVNGIHTDGTLTVEISGLGSPVAGVADSFEWEADRPIALVIVRSGIGGEDVDVEVGPRKHGLARAARTGDRTAIRYVAFCYDAPSGTAAAPGAAEAAVLVGEPAARPAENLARRRLAAARAFAPSGRDRRSILGRILGGSPVPRAAV